MAESKKMIFVDSPSKYKVIFAIQNIELVVGNMAAYQYNINKPLVPLHTFGNANPVGFNEGVIDVDGAIIFNVINTDFEYDLVRVLKMISENAKYKADALKVCVAISGKTDIADLQPDDVDLDNLPSFTLKLEGSKDREVINGVVFYDGETSIGLSEIGLKRIIKFKATSVNQLAKK